MFDLILIAFLSYRNGARAKGKDLNPVLWGIITLFAYISAMVLGFLVVIYTFCRDTINMDRLSGLDMKARNAVAQQVAQVFLANPLHLITVELFGIGGYLLVRYILERKPGKKDPEVHWMDKLGS